MHTPVEDSHEAALSSKLGAPTAVEQPLITDEGYRLYVPQELVGTILRDLYARHHRILGHYHDSPLASPEALLTAFKMAEFDRIVDILANLGDWLEGFQLTLFAHLKNLYEVPLGQEPLPLPGPPPPLPGKDEPDA